MKYIVYEDIHFLMFSEGESHERFAHLKPQSAGFVEIDGSDTDESITPFCYGESKSLGLKSRGPEDERIINIGLNKY